MKIKETPQFVQDLIMKNMVAEYPNNIEMVSAIITLSTTHNITEYLPEMDNMQQAISLMEEYNKCNEQFHNHSHTHAYIAGTKRTLFADAANQYFDLLETMILSKIGGGLK